MHPARLSCAIGIAVVCAACGSKAARSISDDPRPPKEDTYDESAGPPLAVLGAANEATVRSPADATPGPDGELVYFVATTPDDDGALGAVYRAQADGSDVTALITGEPLSAPVGIAIGGDGETLFVADLGAEGDGAILRGSASDSGGEWSPVAGTVGLAPRAVSVLVDGSREWVHFSGQMRDGGEPALYRFDASGNEVEVVASGDPLVAPAGIVGSAAGTIYAIDALADGGSAALLQVADGEVSEVVGGLGVGFPAGLTLDKDERLALVSGLSPETGRDVVYVVDLETRSLSRITDPVDAFAEPAGLHRAHNKNVFAWADSEANDTGTVFVLTL